MSSWYTRNFESSSEVRILVYPAGTGNTMLIEPVEEPPHPPAGGEGSRMLRGLMLRMKKIFLLFLMFSKYF